MLICSYYLRVSDGTRNPLAWTTIRIRRVRGDVIWLVQAVYVMSSDVRLSLVPCWYPERPVRGVGLSRGSPLPHPRNRRRPGSAARRPRGTGALFVKRDGAGRETWYGKWRVGRVQVKRRVGPKRIPSTREGLTRTQAETELRRLIGAIDHATVQRERVTVEEVGELLVASVRAKGRKRSTLEAYSSTIRVHLVPFFGARTLDQIGRREVKSFMAHMSRTGRAPKTTLNAVGILHSIFEYARREGSSGRPHHPEHKPRVSESDPDIRFEPEEIEALLRGVPDDALGRVERRMYLAATMTGMRQGELLALRWRDIDWPARRVRVRRTTSGEFGTPKSRSSPQRPGPARRRTGPSASGDRLPAR